MDSPLPSIPSDPPTHRNKTNKIKDKEPLLPIIVTKPRSKPSGELVMDPPLLDMPTSSQN